MAFEMWAGEKWKGTLKQNEALKREARKRGIPVYMWSFRTGRTGRFIVPKILRAPPRTWKHERIAVRGRLQSRYRDLKTGRFIKKPF